MEEQTHTPPATVKAEGQVEVQVDAVTPREMHAHLGRVYERIDHVDERIGDVQLTAEKRFGRVERILVGLVILVASPKVGGPDATHVITALAQHFYT